jgi:hypothetical protein
MFQLAYKGSHLFNLNLSFFLMKRKVIGGYITVEYIYFRHVYFMILCTYTIAFDIYLPLCNLLL